MWLVVFITTIPPMDAAKYLSDNGVALTILVAMGIFVYREAWPFARDQYLKWQLEQTEIRKQTLDIIKSQHDDFIKALSLRDQVAAEQAGTLRALTDTLKGIHEMQVKGRRERDKL